jgi:hypothetical protein
VITIQVRTDIPRQPRIKSPRFLDMQMARIAVVGLASVKSRVKQGIGAFDQAMPPLKPGYARQKTKRGGLNVRNLTLTGAMLDNLTLRSATTDRATIALTKNLERTKALANQRRSPWLGWSPRDQVAIAGESAKIFNAEIIPAVRNSIKRLSAA